ncbi:MAG: VanZ family protein [Phycisphaeraceae bacterium]
MNGEHGGEDDRPEAGDGPSPRLASARRWLERHGRWLLAGYWLALAVGTHWPNLSLMPEQDEPWVFEDVLKTDKLFHAMGFGGLMALLILAEVGGRGRPWARRCGAALVVGVVYAVLDELTQGLVPGREVNLADVVSNLLAVVGVYLLAVLPAERAEPRKPPRTLLWLLGLSLPALGALALSPAVMHQARAWARALSDGARSSVHPFDHVMHGVLAVALSVVVIVVWPMSSRRPRRSAAWALAVLILAGPALEVVQHYTGRSVQWQDALAHAIGVLLAMMWWAARLSCSPSLRASAGPAGRGAAAPGIGPSG